MVPWTQAHDPWQQQAETARAQSERAAQTLTTQQAEAARLQNQQKMLEMQDEQISREAMRNSVDASGKTDPDKYIIGLVKGGASPKAIFAAHQGVFQMKQNTLKLSEDERKDAEARNDQVSGALEAYQAAPPEQRGALWPSIVQQVAKVDPSYAQTLPPQDPGQEFVDRHHDLLGMRGAILKQAEAKAALAKTQAEGKKIGTEADAQQRATDATLLRAAAMRGPDALNEARAQLPPDRAKFFEGTNDPDELLRRGMPPNESVSAEKTQVETNIQKLQFQAMRSQKPEDWDKVIDQIAPPAPSKDGTPDANAATKALVRSAMAAGAKPETIQAIVGDASKKVQADRASMDLMLREQPFKLRQAVAQAVATARAMQGTGPTAGVAPALQSKATDQYEKSGMTLANALSASDEMKTFIDLARGGNKIAYAYAPTTGVLTINSANGTKRVNMAEIDKYSGAGSDWDKVKQFFGKHTEGASIDPEILKAMEETHSALADVAERKHAMEVSAINQATGAAFQPMKLRQPASGPGAPQPIRVKRKSDGKTGTMDPKDFDPKKYDKIQ